jgi:ribosomal RNA-processing protein 36
VPYRNELKIVFVITMIDSCSDSDSDSSDAGNSSDLEPKLNDTDSDATGSSDDDERNAREQSTTSVSASDNDSDDDYKEARKTSEPNNTYNMPLGERLKQQQDAGVDLQSARERKNRARNIVQQRLQQQQKKKSTIEKSSKSKKHAPTEASSKRADFYRAKLLLTGTGVDLNVHRYKPRDPRVDSMSGTLNQDHFERNYEFLNAIRDQEIETLKKRIAAYKKTGRAGQKARQRLSLGPSHSDAEQADKDELKRLLQEKAEIQRNQVNRAVKRTVNKQLEQGGAFFVKRKERKRMEVEAKFDELKKRGGNRAVNQAVAKRRKKNKSRDAGLLQDAK